MFESRNTLLFRLFVLPINLYQMLKYLAGLGLLIPLFIFSCSNERTADQSGSSHVILPDTNKMPEGEFGEMVKYGRKLMLNTAYYIGPKGISGQYLGNSMNCTNCHQDAGTKPFSLNLMRSHERYPQYRARENRVLTLTERVNNCVMRPHSGIPLPHDSKEMTAILSYLKWINESVVKEKAFKGEKNLEVTLMNRAADYNKGKEVYVSKCQRCHGANGEGIFTADSVTYTYPPLWGKYGYQPGSSMHRVIMQARWIKANMPHDLAKWDKPFLTDEEALDVAAFVNCDSLHSRPNPKTLDYPVAKTKAIDYGVGPFADTFSAFQHKYGPYPPIIDYWKANGLTPKY